MSYEALISAITRQEALNQALAKLYSIAGGSIDSGDVKAASLTTAQRIEYIKTEEFRRWVRTEREAGNRVFWPKDVDKTQGAGDVFTFMFDFWTKNQTFSGRQLNVLQDFVRANRQKAGLRRTPSSKRAPAVVLDMFRSKLDGKPGIGLLDFWSGAYWPSQVGLTRKEKLEQVAAFAPQYVQKIYPGVAEENRALEEAGVDVVIVSNGDQDVAIAIAPYLGVKPENVVGSHLMYDSNGIALGVNHSYEVFDKEWEVRPQPGKALSFHYWAHVNRARFGWKNLDHRKMIFAGRDGDSASSDGGMMIHLPPAALGNFMVDTPGEPDRISKFYSLAAKYGWTKGHFFTLEQAPSLSGAHPG